jgi:hypothetical protein
MSQTAQLPIKSRAYGRHSLRYDLPAPGKRLPMWILTVLSANKTVTALRKFIELYESIKFVRYCQFSASPLRFMSVPYWLATNPPLYIQDGWPKSPKSRCGSLFHHIFNTFHAAYYLKLKKKVLRRTNRLLSLIRHGPHWKRRVQQFFYCCVCIRYRGNVSTEPLPSNDKGIFTDPLPSNDKGIFTEPLPSNNMGIHRQTHAQTATWSHKPTLFFSKWNYANNGQQMAGEVSLHWKHQTL